jgi:hypothetical protein
MPDDLEIPFDSFFKNKEGSGKSYKEDQLDIKNLISNELNMNKELIEQGDRDSS